jgi:hypothetical protein
MEEFSHFMVVCDQEPGDWMMVVILGQAGRKLPDGGSSCNYICLYFWIHSLLHHSLQVMDHQLKHRVRIGIQAMLWVFVDWKLLHLRKRMTFG